MALDLIASLLFGSSLSALLSPKIISFFHLNFFSSSFSQSIPSFSSEVVAAKNLDLVEFAAVFIISLAFFALNILSSRKSPGKNIFSYWYLSAAALVFLQTHFVFTSTATMLVLVFLVQLTYAAVRVFALKPKVHFNWLILANGILSGFYLLLLANKFTSVPAALLFILVSLPYFYACFNYLSQGKFSSPAHLLLLLALFNPLSVPWLAGVGVLALVCILFLRLKPSLSVWSYLYPVAIIFLFVYNPLYFVGNFDSVEEGFWAGWNQRLLLGNVPYRDFLVYHPPFLLWGLHLFSLVFGFTLNSQKLFFHLLQIAGLASFYFLSSQLVKKPIFRILLVLAAASFSGTLVANNFEIRLGFGLLAILFWYRKRPLVSGIFTAISLFVSLEVGLVAFIVLLFAHIKRPAKYLLGIAVIVLPTLAYLSAFGALSGFVSQLSFYSQAFSAGYFNSPASRQFLSSYFHWHIFNQYVSADFPVMWEVSQLVIFGSFLYAAFQVVRRRASVDVQLVLAISLFGLGLFRSALGRSDFYHLLPLVWLALLLVFHYLEKYSALLAVVLLLLFARNPINASFLENYIFRVQNYGRVIGEWQQFASPRSNLLLSQDANADEYSQLLSFISSHTLSTDKIFIYPWDPQLYFLGNRQNSTSTDVPYAFFTPAYQQQIISELQAHPPKLVIYNSKKYFGNMKPESLPLLTGYIVSAFPRQIASFGNYQIIAP